MADLVRLGRVWIEELLEAQADDTHGLRRSACVSSQIPAPIHGMIPWCYAQQSGGVAQSRQPKPSASVASAEVLDKNATRHTHLTSVTHPPRAPA